MILFCTPYGTKDMDTQYCMNSYIPDIFPSSVDCHVSSLRPDSSDTGSGRDSPVQSMEGKN